MTIPAVLFGVLISTLYGAAFHLWRGGNLSKLSLYIIASWIGFWIGHGMGGWMDVSFLDLGPLHLGMATMGSLLFIWMASLLDPHRDDEKS